MKAYFGEAGSNSSSSDSDTQKESLDSSKSDDEDETESDRNDKVVPSKEISWLKTHAVSQSSFCTNLVLCQNPYILVSRFFSTLRDSRILICLTLIVVSS